MTSAVVATRGAAREPEPTQSLWDPQQAFKVAVRYDALVEAVSAAARVVPKKKSTLASASCLLLEADASSNALLITSTDVYMLQVTHFLPARVRRSGRIAVPARVLCEYLQALKGEADDVLLATSPTRPWLHLVLGRFRARLATLPAEEFPLVERPLDPVEHTLDGRVLEQLAARTVFAALDRSPDRVIGSVVVKMSETTLTLVAADGYRLAHAEATSDASTGELAVLVPKDAAEELMVLLARNSGANVVLRHAGEEGWRVLEIEAEAFRMLIRFHAAGEFPDYVSMLTPSEGTPCVASVRRDELQRVVATQAAFGGDTGRLELVARSAGQLEIGAERDLSIDGQPRRSDARVQVDAEISGPEARVSVRGNHVRDALATLTSELVELRLERQSLVLSDQDGTRHVLL